MAQAICPAPCYRLPQPRLGFRPNRRRTTGFAAGGEEEQLALPQDGEDDHLPLACKALNCVQTRDTKKLGKAENRYWPLGLMRRMCAPTGQSSPFGSLDPSAFTYSKLFSRAESRLQDYRIPATARAARHCATARTSWRRAVRDLSSPCSIARNSRSLRRLSRSS
jgi:hypothetical protein